MTFCMSSKRCQQRMETWETRQEVPLMVSNKAKRPPAHMPGTSLLTPCPISPAALVAPLLHFDQIPTWLMSPHLLRGILVCLALMMENLKACVWRQKRSKVVLQTTAKICFPSGRISSSQPRTGGKGDDLAVFEKQHLSLRTGQELAPLQGGKLQL